MQNVTVSMGTKVIHVSSRMFVSLIVEPRECACLEHASASLGGGDRRVKKKHTEIVHCGNHSLFTDCRSDAAGMVVVMWTRDFANVHPVGWAMHVASQLTECRPMHRL